MDPSASVYADTWSTQTWVVMFSLMAVFVTTLMVALIALIHHSVEHSADTPRTPVLDLPGALSGSPNGQLPPGTTGPRHAA